MTLPSLEGGLRPWSVVPGPLYNAQSAESTEQSVQFLIYKRYALGAMRSAANGVSQLTTNYGRDVVPSCVDKP